MLDIPGLDIPALKASLRGPLIQPGDSDYDAVRVVWNAMIDRRPALIARCCGVADVLALVAFARAHGLRVAVRGGGHNAAGYSVCDGGLMIDLSLMRAVRVDPERRRAWVQGGATWGDVDHETAAFGLATPGGVVSTTGFGGLTLSGGIGWLRQTHGLCIDNVAAVDIVTADGRLLHVDEIRHPDLFWAVRGGGGNFGIVTSFEFHLHPIAPELMFCAPLYPEAEAGAVMAAWRDFMATAPARLCSLVEFSTIPDLEDYPPEARGARVIAVAGIYDGPADEGEAAVRPLREIAEPVVDFSGRMSYPAIQSLYDSLFPKGRDRSYLKSHYLSGLGSHVIDDIVGCWASRPSDLSLTSVWHLGGAMQRVAPDATAFGDRSMPFMLSIDSIWSKPADDAANLAWSREFWTTMQRHATGRLYLNFAGHGEEDGLVRQAHGAEVYARLAAVKRSYDPDNFFRMNQNIAMA